MADLGHELTDKELKKLERRIKQEYRIAVNDMKQKLTDYLEKTEEARKVQESLYKAGEITKKEYTDWCYRHTMIGNRWKEMKSVLAKDMVNANKIALNIAKGKMPDVYALNGNFATYQIEHDGRIDTGFTLYNHDTAEYLLSEQRELMPAPSAKKAKEIAANKDMQWNMQKIQSSVLQGVLQGESPYDVANRLTQVGQMNYNAAVRYARTMTTNAQNAGRYEAYRRAKRLGVDLTIEWQATLDGRTRHEHRMMHGQRREVDEPFEVDGIEILWPAQTKNGSSDIPQSMIWNCRCTLLSWVKGFEGDTVKSSPKMGEKSFEEWQNEKAPEEIPSKSFTETLTETDKDRANFDYVFGDNGERDWSGYYEDGSEKVTAIEDTLAKLQEKYPMQATNGKEYTSTAQKVVVCDYDNAYRHLPNGRGDRRLDYEATAQVFENYVTKNGKEVKEVVIAFNRDYLSIKQTLQQTIDKRARRIASGETMWNVGGFTNVEATVIHEWGHVYSNHMDSAMIYEEPAAKEYWEWYKTLSKDDIRNGISDYATTNRGEFEAECFLEMQMPNPRPLAVKWWGFMERVLKLGY